MSWHLGRLAGFDTESTGVDVDNDRIVTACVVQCGGKQPTQSATWMADPGIDIPEAATAVHGITTEQARAEGRPAAEVVEQVVAALTQVAREGIPIVAMNGVFDFTLLEREAERHGVQSLFVNVTPHVIDPRILDKQVDPYRKGKRTLTDLCRHYGVKLDGAHTADADALAACRVAWRIGTLHPDLGRMPLAELHDLQVAWAKRQSESFAAYLRRTPGREHEADGVRTDWPLIPAQRDGGVS